MANQKKVNLNKIYDTKAQKKAAVNNDTLKAVRGISSYTGMKETEILKAKAIGAKQGAKSKAYKQATLGLAEGETKVARQIEKTLNSRNRAAKKCK